MWLIFGFFFLPTSLFSCIVRCCLEWFAFFLCASLLCEFLLPLFPCCSWLVVQVLIIDLLLWQTGGINITVHSIGLISTLVTWHKTFQYVEPFEVGDFFLTRNFRHKPSEPGPPNIDTTSSFLRWITLLIPFLFGYLGLILYIFDFRLLDFS